MTAQLGNILAPEATGPRGPDLAVELELPRAALGDPDGYPIEIPRQVAHSGGYVERVVSPFDEGDIVVLRLPAGFLAGGVLKLRGQGGACEDGQPGDLLVTIRLGDGQLARLGQTGLVRPGRVGVATIGVLLLIVAALAWALL